MKKRGQAGIEYMIIVGFVTFAIMSVLVLAYFYSNSIKDRISQNQIELFANKIIRSAESVFYSGEPSKATIPIYIPDNVISIEVANYEIFVSARNPFGITKSSFSSKVPLTGTVSASSGSKKIIITAESNSVLLS